MLPKRKNTYRPKPMKRESLWRKRKATIRYLLYFVVGLLLGSAAAVLCGVESIPSRILVNQLQIVQEYGVWGLWRERLLFMAILLLYLMVAARCLWGNGMIPAVPLLYGLGQGATISFLLMLLGWNGIVYLLAAVILPRTVQLAALILLCNLAHNQCEQQGGSPEGAGQTMLWVLSSLLLAGGGLLEAAIKVKMTAGVL